MREFIFLISDVISSYIDATFLHIDVTFLHRVSHSYIRQLKCSSAVNMRTCQGRQECIVVTTVDLKEYIN